MDSILDKTASKGFARESSVPIYKSALADSGLDKKSHCGRLTREERLSRPALWGREPKLASQEDVMPRPRSHDEVEHYEAELAAAAKKLEDAKARFKARKASEDHRRWLLAGQAAVAHMQSATDSDFFKTMMGLLNDHARSAADRSLFGLGSKTSNGAGNGGSAPLSGADGESD
jgi:hypothetical protein